MFNLLYSDQALKQLEKLDTSMEERVLKTLERSRIRPTSYAKKLVSSPYFRLRVGDYRVIVDIQHKEIIILVIEVGYRKNVYE